jgi:hypothetical protein
MAIEILWASESPNSWRVLLGAVLKGVEYKSTLNVERSEIEPSGADIRP